MPKVTKGKKPLPPGVGELDYDHPDYPVASDSPFDTREDRKRSRQRLMRSIHRGRAESGVFKETIEHRTQGKQRILEGGSPKQFKANRAMGFGMLKKRVLDWWKKGKTY